MAKIRDTRGRHGTGSGYARLVGNAELGQLLSRTHGTVIRNGNELEHLLAERCAFRRVGLQQRVDGLANGLLDGDAGTAIEVYFGERVRIPGQPRATTCDIVIIDAQANAALVIELKDGDTFDTKKSEGELRSMTLLAAWLARRLGFETSLRFCSFNQTDEEAIMVGAKGRFNAEQVMTGQALCSLIGIDYAEVQRTRERDAQDNLEYFVSEVRRIVGL